MAALAPREEIFISYGREPKVNDFVTKLKQDLEKERFSVWLDTDGIHSGSEWPAALGTALNNCKAIIPVITNKFTKSRFCKKELNRASKDKLMFPVFFEDVDLSSDESQWLSFSITDIQWTNFRPDTDYNVSLDKLVRGLRIQGLGNKSDTTDGDLANKTSAPPKSSSASQPTSGLDSRPSLAQLEELKTKDGKVINFIQDMCCDWQRVGIAFNFDDMGNTVERIQREKAANGIEACLREVMRLWLKRSTSEDPSTWRKLIDMLYSIEFSYLAENLENNFK